MTQREFDVEFQRYMWDRKAAEIRRAETAINAYRLSLIRRSIRPFDDEHYLFMRVGLGCLQKELDEITDRLMHLGVQMELTRTTHALRSKRERQREQERERLEAMMRGNYTRYDGEDV